MGLTWHGCIKVARPGYRPPLIYVVDSNFPLQEFTVILIVWLPILYINFKINIFLSDLDREKGVIASCVFCYGAQKQDTTDSHPGSSARKWPPADWGAPRKKLVPGCSSSTGAVRSSILKLHCLAYMVVQLGQDRAFIGGRQLPSNILWHFAELLSCTSPGHGLSLTGSCYLEGHLHFFRKSIFTFKLTCKWFWARPYHSFSTAKHFCHFMGLPVAGLTVENWQNWENWNILNFPPTSDVSRWPDQVVSTISLQTMHHSVPWSLLHPLVVILLTLGETFYP